MKDERQNSNDHPFDLEERTAKLGEAIIQFANKVSINVTTSVLVSQLIRSGTSVGANYCEANDAESKKDFRHKIGICRKESKETQYWLRMIVSTQPDKREEAKALWLETKELNLIFGAIIRRSQP